MIVIYNDKIIITPDEQWYSNIKAQLTYIKRGRTVYLKNKHKIQTPDEIQEVFTLDEKQNMCIPAGLYPFLQNYFSDSYVVDNRIYSNKYDTSNIIKNINDYKNILDGITLRDAQIKSIWKALRYKRGILQLATGSGKSEIFCAISKLLSMTNNDIYPTILILEPTIRLVQDSIKRCKKYDIPATEYNKNRKIIPNTINIAHPSSLGNDLDKDPELLKEVEVLFCDETHHLKADTWRRPIVNLTNCEYFIGLSASAIDQSHVGCNYLQGYTYDELLCIGAAGNLLINITTGDQVQKEALATPVLCIIENSLKDIELKRADDWHEIQEVHLMSPQRINSICQAAITFSNLNRKVLILATTITFARLICNRLYEYGVDSICAFGGNKFEKAQEQSIKTMEEFDNGSVNILIGSSVMIEGVDLKNLDVLIMAVGGKSERIQTQGVGRVLRKSKNGKYAYIVELKDKDSSVLNNQFKERLKRYKKIMEISDDRIFNIREDNIIIGINNMLSIMMDKGGN